MPLAREGEPEPVVVDLTRFHDPNTFAAGRDFRDVKEIPKLNAMSLKATFSAENLATTRCPGRS